MSSAVIRFERVCLIGGGPLMIDAARIVREHGYWLRAILAPRHAAEVLASGETVEQALIAAGAAPLVIDDINTADLGELGAAGATTMALCLGPSWIFSPGVLAQFGAGMFNLNAIPVPRYLGGAHFTWQILNGDRTGGVFIQRITTALDRGPVLFSRRFTLPPTARRPVHYFEGAFAESRQCMAEFFAALAGGQPLASVDYASFDQQRLYFPRLLTREHAYIDWSWQAGEIVRFCDAFDEPYPGAMTFLDDMRLHVRSVELVEEGAGFHPFTAGLVVRALPGQVVIAARGGALRVGSATDHSGSPVLARLREGRRLVTPAERLEHALTFRARLTSQGFANK